MWGFALWGCGVWGSEVWAYGLLVCGVQGNGHPYTGHMQKNNDRKITFWDPAINICKLILLDQLITILNIIRRTR